MNEPTYLLQALYGHQIWASLAEHFQSDEACWFYTLLFLHIHHLHKLGTRGFQVKKLFHENSLRVGADYHRLYSFHLVLHQQIQLNNVSSWQLKVTLRSLVFSTSLPTFPNLRLHRICKFCRPLHFFTRRKQPFLSLTHPLRKAAILERLHDFSLFMKVMLPIRMCSRVVQCKAGE